MRGTVLQAPPASVLPACGRYQRHWDDRGELYRGQPVHRSTVGAEPMARDAIQTRASTFSAYTPISDDRRCQGTDKRNSGRLPRRLLQHRRLNGDGSNTVYAIWSDTRNASTLPR